MSETIASPLVRAFNIKRWRDGEWRRSNDHVAVEEPLQIRIISRFKERQVSQTLAMTMRTPGADRELAAGLLLSEGIIRNRDDLVSLRQLGASPSNEIAAELATGLDFESWRVERASFVNSSCGICGKRSREALAAQIPPAADEAFRVDPSVIEKLPDLLRDHQAGFSQTGGLHAAALVTKDGDVRQVFEDIGRHNALDKLIGYAVLQRFTPLGEYILFLSSRSSFELIQKAAMAGAPVIATVGAPSSLAIETAREYSITLISFVRQGRFNVYSGEWRIHSK